jgi:two-component system LytT family response regulator
MTTRVLVVDDEAISRRRIRRLLASEADVAIVGECADGASALKAIAADHPDVVFLDVQMPELDGFAVVERVKPSTLPAVVFVTAFDRYAVRAFDVHAIDYLLKPFSN